MTPDVVVDIGNSRMKWGRCADGRVRDKVVLPLDDPALWANQFGVWSLPLKSRWAIAGVNPQSEKRFIAWLETRARTIVTINHSQFQGLKVAVDTPSQVGIDRLLTALAARRAGPTDRPVIVINVGTAMTIDLVDAAGTFAGGAILPGPFLMARSLHEYTAKLPQVPIDAARPIGNWGRNTQEAIEVGIGAAVAGAADFLVWEWANRFDPKPRVFVTGGDSGYFSGFEFTADVGPAVIDDFLTLDGLRIAAEALP